MTDTSKPGSSLQKASNAKVDAAKRLVIAISALVLVATANYLSFKFFHRWDWTSDHAFTLSPRSARVIRDLGSDVAATIVMNPSDPHHAEVRSLLERFRAISPRLTFRTLDPDRNPSEYRLFAGRLGSESLDDVAVVLETRTRNYRVRRDDLVTPDFEAFENDGVEELDVRSEEALTGGLLEVTEGRPTKVCVTAGHGERSLEGEADDSLSAFREELRGENMLLEEVVLRGAAAVPTDCQALFIIGPQTAFSDPEVTLVRNYATHGGRLLVAIDPLALLDEPNRSLRNTGLEPLLRDLGVDASIDIVLERSEANRDTTGTVALLDRYSEHASMRALRASRIPVAVTAPRSLRMMADTIEPLVSTSDESVAVRDIGRLMDQGPGVSAGPTDVTGSVHIAAAGELEGGGRLVVLGSASFFEPALIGSTQAGNLAFTSAVLGWLTHRPALIEIPARRVRLPPMMTEADAWSVTWRIAGFLPILSALIAGYVWWTRRK